MPPVDADRLRHMLDASREALAFVSGRTVQDLEQDRMLALAVVKCIEIVGEAASKVSPEARTKHPAIPWLDAVAMRNRLTHGYFDIDHVRVWNTVTRDLAALVPMLEEALASRA